MANIGEPKREIWIEPLQIPVPDYEPQPVEQPQPLGPPASSPTTPDLPVERPVYEPV